MLKEFLDLMSRAHTDGCRVWVQESSSTTRELRIWWPVGDLHGAVEITRGMADGDILAMFDALIAQHLELRTETKPKGGDKQTDQIG